MLRAAFGRYRASPQVQSLYQQLSRNETFNYLWRNSIHVAYGRDLHRRLRLRDLATGKPYCLDLQVTEIGDAPEIRGFLAWPPPQPR